jgi:molecular chaperone GrpE
MSHNETPAPRDDWGDAAPVNEIEALLAEVDQLRATVVGLKEEALRERAELDNQRKRLARDVDVARKFACCPSCCLYSTASTPA